MSANKNYVYRLMRARCECGTMDNYLNVDKDHGVLVNEDQQPLLNANDHTDKNVIHFGNCNSPTNSETRMKTRMLASILGPVATILTHTPLVDGFVSNLGGAFTKCKPQTPIPWDDGNESNCLDGAPTLTLQSQLCCKNGGWITLVPLGEYPDEEELADPQDIDKPIEEEPPLTVVTNGINSSLEDAFNKIQQTGEIDASVTEKVNAALTISTVLPPQYVEYTPEGVSNLMSSLPNDFNFVQDLPINGVANGMIIDQSQFNNFVNGNTTMDATGCGAIATYNVLKMINPSEEINFAHVAYHLEPYGVGNSAFGTIPFGVAHYLNEQGYNVELAYGVENIVEKAASADAAIAVYAYGDNISNVGAHYTAFQPYNNFDTQEFIFYNDDYGVQNHLRTEEEWIKDLEGKKVIGDALAIIINQQ